MEYKNFMVVFTLSYKVQQDMYWKGRFILYLSILPSLVCLHCYTYRLTLPHIWYNLAILAINKVNSLIVICHIHSIQNIDLS